MTLDLAGTRSRRVRWLRSGLLVAGLSVAAWLLAPRIGELPAGLAAMLRADPGWLVAAVVFALLAYVAAAVALQGAVPTHLHPGRTAQLQLAAAFATLLAPAGLASLAVTERYLERAGVPRGQALGAVAVTRLATLVMHLAVLAVLAPTLMRQFAGGVVRGGSLAIAAGVVTVVVVAVVIVSSRRRASILRLRERAIRSFRELAPDRRRLGLLLGGSLGITAARALTLYACLRAVGAPYPLLAVVGLFLAAEAAGAAATTPAGLGVLDGVMLTGLVAFGTAPPRAIAAVLLFRLLTFWGPIVPGALALLDLRRRQLV